jgi:hypothetical protein
VSPLKDPDDLYTIPRNGEIFASRNIRNMAPCSHRNDAPNAAARYRKRSLYRGIKRRYKVEYEQVERVLITPRKCRKTSSLKFADVPFNRSKGHQLL